MYAILPKTNLGVLLVAQFSIKVHDELGRLRLEHRTVASLGKVEVLFQERQCEGFPLKNTT